LKRVNFLIAMAGFASCVALPARGDEVDPTLYHRYSLFPARTAVSTQAAELPRRPKVAWKLRVAGGIAEPPTVSPEGSVLLALSTPILTQYDARGRLEFSARLGASAAATSPIVLGDGRRLVLTEAAEAICFSRRGVFLSRKALPFGALDATTSIAPMPDGGLLLASGRRVVRLDATLGVVTATHFDADVRIALGGEPPLVVESNGAVFELGSDGRALRRGTFAARVDAATRLDRSRVLAIVNNHQLSELDTQQELVTTRFADANLNLYPTIAATQSGEARALTSGDALLGIGADGRERFRAALPALLGPAGASSAEIVVDERGGALISRAGFDLVAVDADGGVFRVDGSACAEPLRPAGMVAGSAVFACRSGVVLRVDEARPSDTRG
jgi:hypothetical protein